MCFREPDIMSPRWDELQKLRSPTPINKAIHKYTFNNGQLTHMHAVGSSFHSKASAWKTKLLYLCAWHAPAKHLENTQWGAFSLTPSFFLFLNCQNPPFFTLMTMFSRQQHWWSMDNFGFDNSIELSISTALSIMHVQQGYKTMYIDHIVYTIVELSSYTCNCILFS